MSAGKRTLLPILAGGLLLGLAAWAVLTPSSGKRAAEPQGESTASEPANPAEEAPTPGPADRTAVPAPEAPEAAEAAGGWPASYRKGLGRVVGRVVDFDGKPMPNFAVDAYVADLVTLLPATSALFGEEPYRPRILDASDRTDGEGRFLLVDLDPKMPHALLLGLGTARAAARFLDRAPGPGETVDMGDVVLAPYATLVGRVVDEAGAGVAGARVRATDLPAIAVAAGAAHVRAGTAVYMNKTVFELPRWADEVIERFPVPTTETGPDGSFRMEGAPIAPAVSVVVDHPKFVTLVRDPVSTKEGGERGLGKLSLEAGETLTGTVADAAGKPVAGAEIMAGAKIALGEAGILREAGKSDAEGKFRVEAMAAVPSYVACRRGPPDAWTVVGPVSPGLDPADVRLAGLHEVELSVRNEQGAPVLEGVDIRYRRAEEWTEVAVLAPPLRAKWRRGAEEGVCVVERVPDGKYEFLVRAKGYAVETTAVEVKDGTGRTAVTLLRSEGLRVRVFAEGSGEPIEYAYVGAREEGAKPFPVDSARTNRGGEARLEGLPKGEHRIFAAHPAYAFIEEKVTLPAESVTLRLHGGGGVEGRVHSGGAPPPETMFLALTPEKGVKMPRFTTTDAEGAFRMTNVDPGEYELHALPRIGTEGFGGFMAWAEAADGSESVDVRVEEGRTTTVDVDLRGATPENAATIRGRVWVNGRAAEGASVQAWSGRRRSAKTDANGLYELTAVAPGEDVNVTVSLPREDGLPGGQSIGSRKLKVPPAAVLEVNFEVDTGALVGRVVSAKTGEPISHAQVWANRLAKGREEGWSNNFAMADAQGRFRMKDVQAGEYRVQARAPRHAAGRAKATVGAGGDSPEVVVSLPSSVLVKGRVLFEAAAVPEERRWAGLSFRRKVEEGEAAEEMEWGGWAQVKLPDGEFETDDLAPGPYTVQLMGPGNYKPLDVVIPEDGASNLVLQATPEPDGAPRHRVFPR